MNSFPQFETQVTIDGFGPLDMHFLHQKSEVQGAIPLLFVHGWPGSFLEVTKMLPLLKGGDGKPAFHVVAPSLPNYGFSGGMFKVRPSHPARISCSVALYLTAFAQRGFNIAKYAEACHKVMLALGYDEYGRRLHFEHMVCSRAADNT